MRAIRLETARTLAVVDVPEPVARDGEAVLEVAACGICGSDLSCYKQGIFAGAILGHELSGTVVGTGARVVVDPKIPCGDCDDCRAGASHRCVDALTRSLGQVSRGGFAERIAVPSTLLHPVPDGLDLATASLAEPLAVALHGLDRVDAAAEAALVLGLGPIGLLAVAALRDRGADPIVGVDPVPERRALAAALGADGLEPDDPRLGSFRPSLVVEATGVASVVADAMNRVAPGGRVLLLGVPMTEMTAWPMAWVTREIRIVGSIAQRVQDFESALDLLARAPSIGQVITDRIALEDVPAAFERLTTGARDAGKITVIP